MILPLKPKENGVRTETELKLCVGWNIPVDVLEIHNGKNHWQYYGLTTIYQRKVIEKFG